MALWITPTDVTFRVDVDFDDHVTACTRTPLSVGYNVWRSVDIDIGDGAGNFCAVCVIIEIKGIHSDEIVGAVATVATDCFGDFKIDHLEERSGVYTVSIFFMGREKKLDVELNTGSVYLGDAALF